MKTVLTALGVVILASCVRIYDTYSCGFGVDDSLQEHAKSGQENPVKQLAVDTPEPDWGALAFDFNQKKIKSIEFETYPESAVMAKNLDLEGLVKATKTISDDEELMRIARYCFSDSNCLRNIIKPGVRGGEGSAYLIGRLTINTTNGQFTIGVGSTGFSIDGNVPGCDTEFYSPAGAELLSMLYCKQSKSPLRVSIVSALNGLRFSEHRRRTFRQLEWNMDGDHRSNVR